MERVVLILGNSVEDIRRTVVSNYGESVEVVEAFSTPTDFADFYKDAPVRVNRIIISEGAFKRDPFNELKILRNMLDSFSVAFDDCFILVSNDEKVLEIMKFFMEDDNFLSASRTRVFNHEAYTNKLIVEYILNKISRKHFVKNSIEYDIVIRKPRESVDTQLLEEDTEGSQDTEVVKLDSNPNQTKEIKNKMSNLESLSNIVSDEKWSNNPIVRDIVKIDSLLTLGASIPKIEIDYSSFFLSNDIKTKDNNIIMVTGEKRSGKSVMAYTIASSAIRAHKVLVVELDLKNLGLSYIAETANKPGTYMLLQDFKSDFKNSIRTLVKSQKRLNFVVANSATLTELKGMDALSLIKLIIMTSRKYFDYVIFDVDFSEVTKFTDLLTYSVKTVVTIPTNLSTVISSARELSSIETITKNNLNGVVFTPVTTYRDIKTIKTVDGVYIAKLLRELLGDGTKVTPEIEVMSFDVDESLFKAINTI